MMNGYQNGYQSGDGDDVDGFNYIMHKLNPISGY